MKIRVEWEEHRTMVSDIEADSVEEVQAEWELRYGSGMVDRIEAFGSEIDGGIDWDSVKIKEVKP